MFFPRSAPLHLTRDQVRGLRLSLNTPVVATEELPIGPARAAILVHEDASGPQVTIGIRSLRASQVALYAFEGDLREESSFAVAVDAALSFAESMGFLFDEDELGAGGAAARARCQGLWRDLLGESAAVPAAPEEPAEELLLEELAEDVAPGAPDSSADDPVFVQDETGGALPDASDFGSATDVFVPRFEGDYGAARRGAPPGLDEGLAFAAAPEPAAAARGADDEASFAGLLSDSSEPDSSDAPDETVAELPPLAAPAAPRPVVGLTKFRTRPAGAAVVGEDAAPAPAASPPPAPKGARALGKLRLVRRLRGGGRKRHAILRLFGSF